MRILYVLPIQNDYFLFLSFFPLAARASNNDPQLYCQTGLEDRPPPPSLHQHYNRDYSQNSLGNKDYSQNSLRDKDYYHIAQPGNSGRPDIDPGDQMALAGNGNRDHSNSEQHHLSRPVIQQQHPPSTVKFYLYAKSFRYKNLICFFFRSGICLSDRKTDFLLILV